MALTFNKLKSSKLAPTDLIPSGRLKGCRVCDVVDEDFEYLIWMQDKGFLAFTNESKLLIANSLTKARAEEHYENEIKPYLVDPEDSDLQDLPF